jgi:hypothetical protein
MNTEGRWPSKNGGRDLLYAATSQGILKITKSCMRKGKKYPPENFRKKCDLANT